VVLVDGIDVDRLGTKCTKPQWISLTTGFYSNLSPRGYITLSTLSITSPRGMVISMTKTVRKRLLLLFLMLIM